MIKIEIKSFWGSVLFVWEAENNTVKETLRNAVLSGADLSGADLSGADLSGADLRNAVLSGADLSGADLRGADLRNAVLSGADLRNADLSGADLSGADLSGADLSGADLRNADLATFKNALWATLLKAIPEIEGLKKSMVEGKINGSQYEGDCACLKGTIANVRGCTVYQIKGFEKRSTDPDEQWFLQFKEGQTPENYSPMKLTLEWIEEFESYLKIK